MHHNVVPLLKPSSVLNKYNSKSRGIFVHLMCVFALYIMRKVNFIISHQWQNKWQVSPSTHFLCWYCPTNLQCCANRPNRGGGGGAHLNSKEVFRTRFQVPPVSNVLVKITLFVSLKKGTISTSVAPSNFAILYVPYSRRMDWMKWMGGGGGVFDVGLVNSIQWWNPNIFVYT